MPGEGLTSDDGEAENDDFEFDGNEFLSPLDLVGEEVTDFGLRCAYEDGRPGSCSPSA